MTTEKETPVKNQTRLRWWMIVLVILGLAVVVFFSIRTVKSFRRLQHLRPMPQSTDVETIRGWMTIRYLSKVYAVPAPVIYEGLGVPPQPGDRLTLDQLNDKFAPEQASLMLEKAKVAITKFQSQQPPPPPTREPPPQTPPPLPTP